MNSQVTISEYASLHGVSVSTVRRRIKAGAIAARLIGGRYYILTGEHVDNHSEHADRQMNSQDEHGGSQSRQGADKSELVTQLQSEVDYLRGQLDKQTSLLAITTQQNTTMVKQLESPPRESVAMWVRSKLVSWREAVVGK